MQGHSFRYEESHGTPPGGKSGGAVSLNTDGIQVKEKGAALYAGESEKLVNVCQGIKIPRLGIICKCVGDRIWKLMRARDLRCNRVNLIYHAIARSEINSAFQ